MPHADFLAGQNKNMANRLHALDTQGTYTPVLTATTTNPNLGADGAAVGSWHRNGHNIRAWIRFNLAGTGANIGTGSYRVSLPFPADTSIMETSGTLGAGSIIGHGYVRHSTLASSVVVVTQLIGASTVFLFQSLAGGSMASDNFNPSRFTLTVEYLADPAALP